MTRSELRALVQMLIADYLARGGAIVVVPMGVSGLDPRGVNHFRGRCAAQGSKRWRKTRFADRAAAIADFREAA